MEDDVNDTARLEELTEQDNVERIDDNRVVVNTGNNTSSNSPVTLTLTLENDEGTTTETFDASSTDGALKKLLSWYIVQTDSDHLSSILSDL